MAVLVSLSAKAQLTTDHTTLTPAQLVQNILVGTGVTVSGVVYTGDTLARGSFSGVSAIGFPTGVMLATGNIDSARHGNYTPSATTSFGTTSLDPELTSIATLDLHDAAILEFDFVPTSDSIKFRYVFASEEYPEFVCSIFNDVFGFFLSGPNPAGGSYTNQNIAIIPGSGGLPVAINTVNPGVPGASGTAGGCTSLAYSSLYTDNTGGTTVTYDGFTHPLTAKAAVICGQSYHIKLAIADVGDNAYDSGVFFEAGSFSSQNVHILPEISYGGSSDTVLYEGCGSACIYFVRTSNLANTDTINVAVGGTATNGVDYNTGVTGVPIPTQLIFAPGVDTISYCVNAVSDGITEGPESLTLAINQTGPCGVISSNAHIWIDEHQPLTVTTAGDTTLCFTASPVTISALVSGGVQPYTYSWTGGAAPVASPSVNPSVTTTYTVTVNDACTAAIDPTPAVTDTVTVKIITANTINVNAGEDVTVCPGDVANLQALITGGATPVTTIWSWGISNDSLNTHTNPAAHLTGSAGGTYVMTVVDFCNNTKSDTVHVTVELSCAISIPNIITPGGGGPSVNDYLYFDGLEKFPGSKLEIYNRWGKSLYTTDNYQNDWSGSKFSDGTYYFVLTVNDGRTIPGFFQIIHGH